ncbi:MAG: hypothetical protein ACJ76H_13205 [Bacteriovoracaceae bacterium]
MKPIFLVMLSMLTFPSFGQPVTAEEYKKLNAGQSADLVCFSLLIKSAQENEKLDRKANETMKLVHDMKQFSNKGKKVEYKNETIPMFDDLKVHNKTLSALLAYGEEAKKLKTTEDLLKFQELVQKDTESFMKEAKVNYYDQCRSLLFTTVGKCRGFLNNAKFFQDCYVRESEAPQEKLLRYAVGMKTFDERLETSKKKK